MPIWKKVPEGMLLSWPEPLSPQQAREPSALMPQVWRAPAPIWLKVPEGTLSSWLKKLLPQQARVPSALTPQVWWEPALIRVKVPEGTVQLVAGVVAPAGGEPSARMPQVW